MLVGFQMTVLIAFAIVAIVHVASGDAPAGLAFDLDWFNPFTGLALSAFVIGVTGSIFAFWGWDTCLTLGEESKDPTKVPGRAGLLCVLSILLTYLLVAVAVMMYAGVGIEGWAWATRRTRTTSSARSPIRCWARGRDRCCSSRCWRPRWPACRPRSCRPRAPCWRWAPTARFPKRFARVSPRFLVPTYCHRGRRRRHRRLLHRGEPAVRSVCCWIPLPRLAS